MSTCSHRNTIVVGVDGSEPSVQALRWAFKEAMLRDASVTAAIFWTPPGISPASMPIPVVTPMDDETEVYREVLAEALRRARAGYEDVPVHEVVEPGMAGTRLTELAEGSEMLVLGSHGHGHVMTALMGSVSAAVIRKANCPVVVIPTRLVAELGPSCSQ
ncbi:universal stress protein [Allokutzneria sp. NRRL B-24872]|uniref:universal stress protein n=1 Tax=Allokutzneria sp. NRRL B-24872 TaxID=1137961 RepID=UPI000A384EF9|nr:universal stress protein [Allokutzneria sp. NRRL B-24872]